MSIRFDGKIALITGRAMGIGGATAQKLCSLGSAVAILEVDPVGGGSAHRKDVRIGRGRADRKAFLHGNDLRSRRKDSGGSASGDSEDPSSDSYAGNLFMGQEQVVLLAARFDD